MGIKTFISKNLVVLVMVPVIIGSHYGWSKLQGVDYLVSPEERKKLPFYSVISLYFSKNFITVLKTLYFSGTRPCQLSTSKYNIDKQK